jgi:predicted nuclease of predicted toxin-antitoxin system
MNLYLDDDSAKAQLVALLRKAGHHVLTPAEAAKAGLSDARHFEYASQNGLIILTRNYEDFLELHDVVQATRGQHHGILVIRSDNDPTRDMTDRGIVNAIAKLEVSGVPVANQLHILNHWQ